MTNVTRVFDDLPAFVAYAEANRRPIQDQREFIQWAGNQTAAQAYASARLGDLPSADKSTAFLDKFEALSFETSRRGWRDDVCGGLPNVPAYLAGHPLNMRRREKRADDRAPITIFANLYVSAQFERTHIETRGAAILALARLLTMARPVELYAGSANTAGNGACVVAVKLDTMPLDLARAAYVLCAPGFQRHIRQQVSIAAGSDKGLSAPDPAAARNAIAQAFPHAEQMLVVPGMLYNDHDGQKIFKDPQAWIIDQIRAAAPEMLEAE